MRNLSDFVEIAVQQNSLPQYLYKYRAINDNTKKIIENNQLWFSKPADFNDPFDCKIIPETNNTLADVITYLEENTTNVPKHEITTLAQSFIKNPVELDRIVKTAVDNVISKSGVCCFSEINDNILMWSHYSEDHKGICLKFDVLQDSQFFIYPLRVDYLDTYPRINYIKQNKEFVNVLIRSKSNDWIYEKEIRVYKRESKLYDFKKEALVEVIFGCKAESDEIDKFKDLVNQNGYNNVVFKKAKLKDFEYGLDFEII